MPRKNQRDKFLAAGLCGTCGKELVFSGRKTCDRCLSFINKPSSKSRTRKPRQPKPPKQKRTDEQIREGKRKVDRARSVRLRRLVLDNYGRSCACCGESTEQFMSVDHVNNDGAQHRREVRGMNGGSIYNWLVANKFPDGFQILCYNCNFAKGRYGVCPHESDRVIGANLLREELAKASATRNQCLDGTAIPSSLALLQEM